MKRNQIVVNGGRDVAGMTRELLEYCDLAGLIRSKLADGGRIGIKPNLVAPTPAELGATTHPEIVGELIAYLKENGFSEIVILEGSWVGDRTRDAVSVCGYDRLCEEYGIPFWDMQEERPVTVDAGGVKLQLCAAVQRIDFLINVPVLKGHCQTKLTCALKNMKGLLPNTEKRRFHALGLHDPIARLNLAVRQDFILVDHICGDLDFEDGGNPVETNRLAAGLDPVLVDAWACSVLGYQPSEVPYIGIAQELGVGSADLSRAELSFLREDGRKVPPASRKVVEVSDCVEEVDSCSACYGNLIPVLDELRQEGLLEGREDLRICIGQGWRGKTGALGVGNCTSRFLTHLKGCPPTQEEMRSFLLDWLREQEAAGSIKE